MENEVLAAWNERGAEGAALEVLACCGSRAWASDVARRRPYAEEGQLFAAADEVWRALSVADWLEAFRRHPRIGEKIGAARTPAAFDAWSRQEQAQTQSAAEATMGAIAEGNRQYEQKFGFTYIVCATGKSAEEMLAILRRRLLSDRDAELWEAAEQQRQITQIRLRKWLANKPEDLNQAMNEVR